MQGTQQTRSGEGIVFLDLESDEYFCHYAPGGDAVCFSRGDTPGTTADRSTDCTVSPWRFDPAPPPSVRIVDLIRFATAFARSAFRYRGRKVGDLILIVQSLRVKGCNDQTPSDVAKIFRSLLPLLPSRPQCLFEAFFLQHFLARYGHRGSWIFGAHLFPFRAHCWLANGNLLLNEAPHRIEDYQIILTAEPAAS